MYVDYEVSNHFAYPVELFEFTSRSAVDRYANHDDTVMIGVDVWAPYMISRTSFTKGMELDRSSITLTVSPTLPVLGLFQDGIPEGALDLVVYRTHLTDSDQELWTIWQGEVVSLKRVGRKVQLTCEPPEVKLRSSGLRRRYQSTCPYPLYKDGCNVDKEDFRTDCTVISKTGVSLKLSVADTSGFVGGMLVFSEGANLTYRQITVAQGDEIQISRPASSLLDGDTVTVYRGCDKSFSTCRSVFGNGINYGGFKDMPSISLFNNKVF